MNTLPPDRDLLTLRIWRYVKKREEPFTTDQLVVEEFRVLPSDVKRADQMRVAEVLRDLGCERQQRRINGVRAQYWSRIKMDSQVFKSKIDGQSAIAKKIFEIVPIQGPQNAQWIASALRGATHRPADLNILKGCLNTLKEAGLIREPKPGYFQRDPKPVAEQKEATQEFTVADDVLPASLTLLERIAMQAARLRAGGLVLLDVADELETIAIEVEEQKKGDSEAAEKLRTLQSVLKGLV